MEPHSEKEQVDKLKKEVDYYKRQLDKLTGDHLRNQYVISKLNTAIKEYTKGFRILADVHRSFSFLNPLQAFHEQVMEAIISHMSVDNLFLFKYDSFNKVLIPYLAKGTPGGEKLKYVSLSLPEAFYADHRTLYASIDSTLTETEQAIKEQLRLPYFILTPLFVNNVCWGALYAGRRHQVRPMFLPFSPSDTDVFEAIAGMIASLTHQLDQHGAVEREQNRIAQEMHDDIGSGLTHIALLSELIQARNKADEETLTEVAKIATTSRSLTDSIGEIIWTLNPQYGTLGDLLTYLREQTTAYFESFDIEYVISFPNEVPDIHLNNQQRRNVYLVIKEALNNALKHSGAARIELNMTSEQQGLCFQVVDDGCGINLSKGRSTSNGLRNLTKRMSDLDGSCMIESSAKGTTISFHFPAG